MADAPATPATPDDVSESSTSRHTTSYSLRIQFTAGNVALLLLFFSACFHSLARYFYSYYKLLFGTLYPCFASFKAIKHKNVKEYVSSSSSSLFLT